MTTATVICVAESLGKMKTAHYMLQGNSIKAGLEVKQNILDV